MNKIAVLNEFSIEAVKDALQKLDAFDKLTVNGLTAFELNELEKIDPVLFEEISDKIKNGRWYPKAGLWLVDDKKMSAEKLMRSILYSVTYFKEKFQKEYRVFQGARIYNDAFAQIVYSAGFDATVLSGETETYWLDGEAYTRTLIYSGLDTVDVNDIDDDFINENDFNSVEEEVLSIYWTELNLNSVKTPVYRDKPSRGEALLEKADRLCVQEGRDENETIRKCWLSLLLGEDAEAAAVAEKIIGDCEINKDFFRFNTDEVEILSVKYAEDATGDVVIRIRETAGTEKALTIMCDALDAGFRAEILPYEIQTFRIDKDGFVEETPIGE